MKNLIIIIVLVVTILPYNIYAQTNYWKSQKVKLSNLYFGLGASVPKYGGFSATFILSNDWGGSISYKRSYPKAKNLPSNYKLATGGFFPAKIPKDYIQMLSLTLIREFPTSNHKIRFGIETGPSWNYYKITKFTPQKATQSNFFGWISTSSNHSRTYDITNSIGMTLRAKVDILFSKALGMEFAIFSNINAVRPLIGLECYFIFGKIRNT